MRKNLLLFLIFSLLIIPFAACGGEDADSNVCDGSSLDVSVGVIGGSTGLAAAWMMTEAGEGNTHDNYDFIIETAPENMVARIMTGAVDFAALPTNLAATLYHRSNGEIQIAAITGYGVLHFVENGETIQSIEDLRGRTIYTMGEGANPEFILRHLLAQNNLIVGTDVDITFLPMEALQTQMAAGLIDLAMMPEPMASVVMTQNADVRRALDVTEEWASISPNSPLIMSVFVVRTEFANRHPYAVDRFLVELEHSIRETINDAATAGERIAQAGIIPAPHLASLAIPGSNLTFIRGAEMQPLVSAYLRVLYEADSESIGGSIPGASFYFLAEE